jgi:hypothetical protein
MSEGVKRGEATSSLQMQEGRKERTEHDILQRRKHSRSFPQFQLLSGGISYLVLFAFLFLSPYECPPPRSFSFITEDALSLRDGSFRVLAMFRARRRTESLSAEDPGGRNGHNRGEERPTFRARNGRDDIEEGRGTTREEGARLTPQPLHLQPPSHVLPEQQEQSPQLPIVMICYSW